MRAGPAPLTLRALGRTQALRMMPSPQLIRALLQQTETNGWARIDTSDRVHHRSLAESLGEFGLRRRQAESDAETLSPRLASRATRPSLSSQFGLAAFPAHVDGAHLRVPPRYILLYCTIDEQRRATRLFPWSSIEYPPPVRAQLSREVFAFRCGARSFLDSVVSPDREFVRLDPGCMIPRTRQAESLLRGVAAAIDASDVVTVEWYRGHAVLIDNWRTLHGRGIAQRIDRRRELIRYTFDNG